MGRRQSKVMSEKNLALKKIAVVFSVLAGIALVVLCSAYVISKEIEKQLRQNLEDVARQNAVVLETKMSDQYKLIHSLSQELKGITKDTIEEKLDLFEIFLEDHHLKRFAYCFPDGITYSTDKGIEDLSYRDFYQKGMEGKCCITGILKDALRPEHNPVNVMTIPVYDDAGAVSGVFGLAYDTEKFNESLQINSFDGKGYSCIINESGEIMSAAGSDGLELSHNIMESMRRMDDRNEAEVECFQKKMMEREAVSGSLYLPEKTYYYSVPVNLMDGSVTWYILTIVPSEVLRGRTVPIQKNQIMTCLLTGFLVLFGAWMIIMYIKEQHREILRFAYEDPVTKGANYAKFQLEMERKQNRVGTLIVMDIANFNNISVVAGKDAGDAMIRKTWEIICEETEKDELAARIRDDVFLLFFKEKEKDRLLQRMEGISEKISEKARDIEVYGIQARYGMYRMEEKEALEDAYSRGKLAREYAVLSPGMHYAFYSEMHRMEMQHEKQLEDRFPQAVGNEEFQVWYQPKYSAGEGRIVGSEALVRWKKEDGEMISPAEFIPLFERNGMIVKLDEYMFRMVCRWQKRWMDEGRKIYPVSINISRASLYSLDIHKRYYGIMKEYGIAPDCIELEVTETVMEEKSDICEILNKFRSRGIKILMDDFGTGYSSLATLSLQCFDTLKLDKTLIDHIGNKDGETMLYHIIRMGQQMGLHITAEGVEKKEQVDFLKNMKCDDIQGFYFSRPVPMDEYEKMLRKDAQLAEKK